MPRDRMDLLPGTLELLVLKTLSRGPAHGYGVARHIQRQSAEALRVEEGSLYPALHRMEKRGWIASEWGLSEANRRAKYYSLTDAGRTRLVAQEEEWTRLSGAIEGVLRAGFAGGEGV